jgi:MFS family permease
VSLLGSQVQAFALGWTATAAGGSLAGLVLTAGVVPQLILTLIGGAVSDRRGPWDVMIWSDALMFIATAGLATAIIVFGAPSWLLLATALVVGTSAAFYTPASGSVPRLLVDGLALGRATAARQTAGQIVSSVAPPLGGLVVVWLGLGGAALVNAVTFLLMFGVLTVMRRRIHRPVAPAAPDGNLLRRTGEGVRLAARDGLLRPLLLLTCVAAAFLLPVTILLIPLLVRSQHWPIHSAGQIIAAQSLGAGIVVVTTTVRNTHPRPGIVAPLGILLAGLATLTLSLVHAPVVLPVIALFTGIGTGTFGTHVTLLILTATPASHLARVQAVLALTQSVPLIITLNVAGPVADRFSPATTIAACGLIAATAGAATLFSRQVRSATLGGSA